MFRRIYQRAKNVPFTQMPRMVRSIAHRKPPTDPQNSSQPMLDSEGELAMKLDSFNLPDPSKYCENLTVKETVAILHDWLAKLDIDRHYPSIPEVANLAALVPHNECLQKLVALGADLSRMESKPGVANLLVKTNFETQISPKLWLLSDYGFDLNGIARVMTYVPKAVIKLSSEEISSRLKYFTDRDFTAAGVVKMVSERPEILAMTSCEVDRKLESIMTTFSFKAQEVRSVVTDAPKCIVDPVKLVKHVFVALTKMLAFPVPTARRMILDYPRLILSSNRIISNNACHLHRRLGMTFDQIALCPRALAAPPRILENRTNFLVLYKRFQPDGSKPLYTPLDSIVEGPDEEFCQRFVDGKEELYDEYLRTI